MRGVYKVNHEFKRHPFESCQLPAGMRNKLRKSNAAAIVKFLCKSLDDDGIPYTMEIDKTQTIIRAEGRSNKQLTRFDRGKEK